MEQQAEKELVEVTDPFQRDNPRSLINLITPGIQIDFMNAYKARPELFGLEEEELDDKLRYEGVPPTKLDNALRARFWIEYDTAQAAHRNMSVRNIIAGLCNDDDLYARILKKPHKVAWLLCRPMDYVTATEEMHMFSLRRMRKTLEQDVVQHGKFNAKLAEAQIKIFQILDTRVKGAVIQKQMNINATIPQSGISTGKNAVEQKEELERRLLELERAAEKARNKIIDARVIESEPGEDKA